MTDTLTLSVVCRECESPHTIKVREEAYKQWRAGRLIQDAMPELTNEDRELLMSSICPECWDKLFA